MARSAKLLIRGFESHPNLQICSEKAASAVLTPMPYAGQRLMGVIRECVPLQNFIGD